MSSESAQASATAAEVRAHWRSLLWGGVLIVGLGVFAVLAPYATGLTLSLLLGVALLLGGVTHVANAFVARGWTGALWQLVLAVVYAGGGIVLIVNPTVGLATLTVLAIAYLIVDGVVEMLVGLAIRSQPRWWWMLISGAVSVVLGVLLWTGLPGTADWAVGLLFGISLVTTGVAMIGVAMTGRNANAPSDTETVGTGTL